MWWCDYWRSNEAAKKNPILIAKCTTELTLFWLHIRMFVGCKKFQNSQRPLISSTLVATALPHNRISTPISHTVHSGWLGKCSDNRRTVQSELCKKAHACLYVLYLYSNGSLLAVLWTLFSERVLQFRYHVLEDGMSGGDRDGGVQARENHLTDLQLLSLIRGTAVKSLIGQKVKKVTESWTVKQRNGALCVSATHVNITESSKSVQWSPWKKTSCGKTLQTGLTI